MNLIVYTQQVCIRYIQPLGMIYYRLDPDYLKNVFDDGYNTSDETVFLYYSNGTLISKEGALSGEQIIKEYEYYQKNPDVYVHSDDEEDYYIITANVEELDLTVITMITSEVLTQDSRKVRDLITILYILNIPLLLLMAYFLYKNIIHPVDYLITKMNKFEDGSFDIRIEEKRYDEFGVVYQASTI